MLQRQLEKNHQDPAFNDAIVAFSVYFISKISQKTFVLEVVCSGCMPSEKSAKVFLVGIRNQDLEVEVHHNRIGEAFGETWKFPLSPPLYHVTSHFSNHVFYLGEGGLFSNLLQNEQILKCQVVEIGEVKSFLNSYIEFLKIKGKKRLFCPFQCLFLRLTAYSFFKNLKRNDCFIVTLPKKLTHNRHDYHLKIE